MGVLTGSILVASQSPSNEAIHGQELSIDSFAKPLAS